MREVPGPAAQSDVLEHLPCKLGRVLTARDLGSELHVLLRSQCREQVERLEDEADAGSAKVEQLPPARPGQVVTGNHDASAGRRVEGADDVQQRRLAASRRPEDDHEVFGGDVERDRVEGDDLDLTNPVAPADAVERDQCARRGVTRVTCVDVMPLDGGHDPTV